MRHLPIRTSTGLALLALLAAGCTGSGEDPGAAQSPPVAGSTASPMPSPTATTSPSPSPSPESPSPSPSPRATAAAGPAAEDDGCPPPHEQRAALPEPAAETPSTSNELITESPAGRPIDVGLTVLEGGSAAEQVTATVRSAVDDLIAEWDQVVGPPSEDSGDQPDPELQLQVTVSRLGSQLASLQLEGYQYLGGASGDALTDAWTFATATGTQLDLARVGLDGPCRDELGGLAADALTDQGVGMFEEAAEQLRAGEVSMQRWSVTDEVLRIHFPEYEVAPGAAGAPVAEIPLPEVHAATGTPLGADG